MARLIVQWILILPAALGVPLMWLMGFVGLSANIQPHAMEGLQQIYPGLSAGWLVVKAAFLFGASAAGLLALCISATITLKGLQGRPRWYLVGGLVAWSALNAVAIVLDRSADEEKAFQGFWVFFLSPLIVAAWNLFLLLAPRPSEPNAAPGPIPETVTKQL